MGLFCEINLCKPLNEVYKPGQEVSGLIKYAVDKPMEIEKITVSLKGHGNIRIERIRDDDKDTSFKREVYVDENILVQDKLIEIPVGLYEIKFSFIIPHNIPSSVKFDRSLNSNKVDCKITYNVCIEFQRPGIFARNKQFVKEITVISGGLASLPRVPLIYGEKKKITQLFSTKTNVVNLEATIFNSVIPIGGKIELNYEVKNNSNVDIKSVKIILVEKYKFDTGTQTWTSENDVPNTDTKTGSIKRGESQNMPVEINIPTDIHSLDNAMIISRNYFVKITIKLPMPHINAVLNIPVQIGAIDDADVNGINNNTVCDDPPPSYWEAMCETEIVNYGGNKDKC